MGNSLLMRVGAIKNAFCPSEVPVLGFLASTTRQPPHAGFHARVPHRRQGAFVEPGQPDRAVVQHPNALIDLCKATGGRAEEFGQIQRAAAVKALVAASSHSPRSFVITQVVTDAPNLWSVINDFATDERVTNDTRYRRPRDQRP